MNYKIRESQTQKIPYTVVLGDNEANSNLVTYRHHGSTESISMPLDEFINKLTQEIATLGK